jgi:hypothetical protein
LYSYILLSILLGDNESIQDSLRYQLASTVGIVQFGFLLSVPLFLELMLQRGFFYAMYTILKLFFTGAPVFFMFQIVWKSFILLEALTLPAALYRATGRGVVLTRMPFIQIYQKYALSHFYLGVELLAGLIIYEIYSHNASASVTYLYITWPIWLVVVAAVGSPFVYNFKAFDYDEVQRDIEEWRAFTAETDDMSPSSWNRWYAECSAKYTGPAVTRSVRLSLMLRGSLLLAVPVVVSVQYGQTAWDLQGVRLATVLAFVVITTIALFATSLQLVPTLRHGRCGCPGWVRLPFVLISCGILLIVLSFASTQIFNEDVHLMSNSSIVVLYLGAWVINPPRDSRPWTLVQVPKIQLATRTSS